MKALVSIKRVVDYNVKVRVKQDGSGLDINNVKMSINPFDEVAVEESVRLKEAGKIDEIIVITLGSSKGEETLRTALAMGADRAILIEASKDLEPLEVAKILQKIVEKEKPELIFLGKQAIDNDANQVGQMLSALIDASQGTFISNLEIKGKEIVVTREIDGGVEKLSLSIPAVITTDLRLNEPRFIKLPNIMQAKKKTLEKINIMDLEVNIDSKLEVLNVAEPQAKARGVKLDTVDELIDKLKNDAKVI